MINTGFEHDVRALEVLVDSLPRLLTRLASTLSFIENLFVSTDFVLTRLCIRGVAAILVVLYVWMKSY